MSKFLPTFKVITIKQIKQELTIQCISEDIALDIAKKSHNKIISTEIVNQKIEEINNEY
tara:strand:+ start:220 stop:396 length:177 start_codon:yes stop_codon:yes gene_type:complete